MARYLVIHSPREDHDRAATPPTRLLELSRLHGADGARPRWLRTWSPDLHDERIFSLWDATDANEILTAIAFYGFLDDMDAKAINVREWGPEDVLLAEGESAEKR